MDFFYFYKLIIFYLDLKVDNILLDGVMNVKVYMKKNVCFFLIEFDKMEIYFFFKVVCILIK